MLRLSPDMEMRHGVVALTEKLTSPPKMGYHMVVYPLPLR